MPDINNPPSKTKKPSRQAVQARHYSRPCTGCGKRRAFRVKEAFTVEGSTTIKSTCPSCKNTVTETIPADKAKELLI